MILGVSGLSCAGLDNPTALEHAGQHVQILQSALEMVVEIHDLSGEGSVLVVAEEEACEYEVEYLFGDAGTYEMHVEMDVNSVEQSGEFHLPISAPEDDDEEVEKTGGGHGH